MSIRLVCVVPIGTLWFPQAQVRINRLSVERVAYCRCWQRRWGVRWAPYHPHAKEQSPTGSVSSGASPPVPPSQAGKPWPPSHYRFPWVRVHTWGCVCHRSSMLQGCIELCNCNAGYQRCLVTVQRAESSSWFLRVNDFRWFLVSRRGGSGNWGSRVKRMWYWRVVLLKT